LVLTFGRRPGGHSDARTFFGDRHRASRGSLGPRGDHHRISRSRGPPGRHRCGAAGDTLRVLPGIYNEAIVITKALKILGMPGISFPSSFPTIDAGCGPSTGLSIAANDVTVRRIVVRGVAGPYGIDVQDRDDVRLLGVYTLSVPQTCSPTQACINVARSTHVRVDPHIEAYGETNPVGVRLAEIAADADVRVMGVKTGWQAAGLVIENSGVGAPVTGARRSVRKSDLGQTDVGGVAGVSLVASDGITLRTSIVRSASNVPVVRLDALSDDNFISHNVFEGGAPIDDGTGNCWHHNQPDVFGCP